MNLRWTLGARAPLLRRTHMVTEPGSHLLPQMLHPSSWTRQVQPRRRRSSARTSFHRQDRRRGAQGRALAPRHGGREVQACARTSRRRRPNARRQEAGQAPQLVDPFVESETCRSWMVLDVIPVIPRPSLAGPDRFPLDGGPASRRRIFNDLYRRVNHTPTTASSRLIELKGARTSSCARESACCQEAVGRAGSTHAAARAASSLAPTSAAQVASATLLKAAGPLPQNLPRQARGSFRPLGDRGRPGAQPSTIGCPAERRWRFELFSKPVHLRQSSRCTAKWPTQKRLRPRQAHGPEMSGRRVWTSLEE